jgi:hypothetical protein
MIKKQNMSLLTPLMAQASPAPVPNAPSGGIPWVLIGIWVVFLCCLVCCCCFVYDMPRRFDGCSSGDDGFLADLLRELLVECLEIQRAAQATLQPGQSLTSRDGRHVAVMQTDGNFVVYSSGNATWALQTVNVPCCKPRS